MKIRQLHPWDVSYKKAIEIQKLLRPQLVLEKLPGRIRYVAGTDVSCSKRSRTVWAGVVLLNYPDLKEVEAKWVTGITNFPYIPGLLSFREIPCVLEALRKLEREPDLIFCDGQGIAHPRGLGLASHLGLLTNKPTIGCAKKRLVGKSSEVGQHQGDYALLFHKTRQVGAVVRTKTGVKPLFISPGYRITLEEAIKMVLNCRSGYKIPEPIRRAHLLVNQLRQKAEVS